MKDSLFAVWIDFPPASVYNCGWKQVYRGGILWETCILRLQDSLRSPVLVCGLPGNGELSHRCHELGIEYAEASSSHSLTGILEIALRHNISTLTVLHGLLGLRLFPPDLVWNTYLKHLDHHTDATVLLDLPAPLSATIIAANHLDLIRELITGLQPKEDMTKVILDLASAFDRSASPAKMKVQKLSFARQVNSNYRMLPHYIPWTYQGDISRIEMAESDAPNEIQSLHKLRDLIVADLQADHRPLVVSPQRFSDELPKRVLYASNPSAYSGAEEALVTSIRSLHGSGIEVHCLIGQEGLFSNRAKEAGAIVHVPNRDCALARIDTIVQMDRLLTQIDPDLIHCNGSIGLPVLTLSRLRGIPFLQWVRVAKPEALIDHLLSADTITAVSEFVAEQVKNQMVCQSKVKVLYDAVDTDLVVANQDLRHQVRSELGISQDSFLFLCIARFVKYKRHEILLNAFFRASQAIANLKLLLVGDPQVGAETYGHSLLQIEALGLQDRVKILGFQESVIGVESACDALVLCSENEPLGTAVLEAMSMSKPIVVAASGGLPEMIQHSVSGLHCLPNDSNSLADAMCRIASEPRLSDSLGRGARLRVEQQFSLAVHREKLLQLYREAIARAI